MDVPHRTVPGVEVSRNSHQKIKQKTKTKSPDSAPCTNEFRGFSRDTQAHQCTVAAFATGRGWTRPHFPADRLRTDPAFC